MAKPKSEITGDQAEMDMALKQNKKSIDAIVTQCKNMKLNIDGEKTKMEGDPESFDADDVARATDLNLYFKNELKTIFQ